jgi:hypothetical protein
MGQQWRKGMKMTLRTVAIATSAFACAALMSLSWSEQGGVSLSINKAEAYTRLVVRPGYAARAAYVHSEGLSWYAVRAYYWGGPWSGAGYSYAGWADYAARNGIGCVPGTVIPGGDGIVYRCQ